MTGRSRPLRADAARNRAKLLDAATAVFGERGLDAPLEQIARHAEVGIATLYAHFPSREALVAAVLPGRLAAVDQLGGVALADPDPWRGFTGFVVGLFALRAQDRGLNDALAEWVAADSEIVREACQRGLDLAEKIIERARLDGRLRSDFTSADLSTIGRAMAHVINESTEATASEWRRCLTFFLDGLRAHPADADSPATTGHPV
ncbi:Transcriptional regulator, TetR family protein [Frankia canadensis]|uniref:Transcriptional regulator, TetR family protein n=1 Tax=Frankia canadensis TaxID=1836972 RepID=A0A2I2L094_9ACTN|nr:TetR/AcrR family transcriptional regulator [Frankia canadensis]SNQ51334.1 Transcriptional regulator, TetR family protein [Frankia canadensis]SOU58624.1 Transcriptional regulator, TetR family protein [Frankia canadensis]